MPVSTIQPGTVDRPTQRRRFALSCLLAALLASPAAAQKQPPKAAPYLDPARDESALQLPPASTLTEQFIWTAGDAAALDPALQAKVRGQNDKIAPHYFRAQFSVREVPEHATLYVAGPRSATVTLNGLKVMEFGDTAAAVRGFHVNAADVAAALRPGQNVLAVEEVRGHSSLHTGAGPVINQVTYGEVLAVKIVPRAIAEDAPPLLVSDASWRSTLQPAANWTAPTFDDSAWPAVQTLGVLGSRSDFLQWNADAGLYAWPGYSGISPAMRTFRVPPVSVLKGDAIASQHVTDASLQLTVHSSKLYEDVLTPNGEITPGSAATLDFGKEISGRIHLVSSADHPVTVGVSYGESAEEALAHPFLGVREVTVPPHGEAYGPKSAFRYARLVFPGDDHTRWSAIDAQGIAYPVEYKGSFESSDPLLNRIWETGAYTAHLCMQEDIWDAPKRDRGRWMGDLDVSGRVISDVFADRSLMESTMTAILDDSHLPVDRDINTIAGYSALWITGQADFYRHTGDLTYLRTLHERLLSLLHFMDAELDPATGLFANPAGHKVFVDWAGPFSSDTPEARAATHLEFALAYGQAAYLLTELGDAANAATYRAMANRMLTAAQAHLLDPATSAYGARWQTNAIAVLSGAATPAQQKAIWTRVLSQVVPEMSKPDPHPSVTITPYYGYYVLSAMARLNHRHEALDWMRQYWGGMIAEGATSFWEGYDPRWPKQDFHAYLEADGKAGYYTSLAHGWSSGPTAWLMEQVLGIEPTAAAFHAVTLRPDLAGLEWAHGTEPTPRGPIALSLDRTTVHLTLPSDTVASVSLPFAPTSTIRENGKTIPITATEDGTRSLITLNEPGDYTFTAKGN